MDDRVKRIFEESPLANTAKHRLCPFFWTDFSARVQQRRKTRPASNKARIRDTDYKPSVLNLDARNRLSISINDPAMSDFSFPLSPTWRLLERP